MTPSPSSPPVSTASSAATQPAERWRGPRERLAEVGARGLSDEELVAVLLGTGSGKESVLALAARLLREGGGLMGLRHLGAGHLASQHGVGPAKAARVVAGLELGRRARVQPLRCDQPLTSSELVYATYGPKLEDLPNEHFFALALDARARPIAEILIAEGEPAACAVAPGEVFRRLLREAAVSCIFIHNHPSGDPLPSREDVELTKVLVDGGNLLGIRVLDHIVVGRGRYLSFLDEGLLPESGFLAI